VDLWGRLSNPPETLEKISDQRWSSPQRPSDGIKEAHERPDSGPAAGPPEQKGRLSNPVQRRLSAADIGDLCHLYSEGRSIDALARQYELNRTTIITHLDHAGIERRRVRRKMTGDSVASAATRYGQGASLAIVAKEFEVHARTLAREFRQAGVATRPRHGS
jgi:AraC-like DNA-binding protein